MSFSKYLTEKLGQSNNKLIIKFDNKLEADKAYADVVKDSKDIIEDLINITQDGEIIFEPKSMDRYKSIRNLFQTKTNGEVR